MPPHDLLIPIGRASFVLDFIALALVVIIPLQLWSIRQAKRGRLVLHKRLQIGTAAVLFVAVTLFEIDIRVNPWRELAKDSIYWDTWVFPSLYVHLVFAISTPFLWLITLIAAWRGFPKPPAPAEHSRWHRRLGWASFLALTLTSITGWIFYYVSFVC